MVDDTNSRNCRYSIYLMNIASNNRVQRTLHKVSGSLTRDVGSEKWAAARLMDLPHCQGKRIDSTETIWESEARNSR